MLSFINTILIKPFLGLLKTPRYVIPLLFTCKASICVEELFKYANKFKFQLMNNKPKT